MDEIREVKHMKRPVKSAILLALILMLFPCSAYAAEGLDSFVDSRSMDGTTFADVKTSSWFYNGVKSAYDMAIMEGMGGGRFEPNQTVPWSQAVTIAARAPAANHRDTTVTVAASATRNATVSTSQTIAAQFINAASFL
jgi:hypothetical protein